MYFITFKDDYSCYGYLYLIHGKFQSLDMFKIYKVKENQLNRRIKAVRSDRGGEYCDKYGGSGRCSGPFARNQLNRRIKTVRFDCGGEYYDRYDGSYRCPRSFASFLEECGIVPQYTMRGTPRQNGVAER